MLRPTHAGICYAEVSGHPLALDLYLPNAESTNRATNHGTIHATNQATPPATLGEVGAGLPVLARFHWGGWAKMARAPVPPWYRHYLDAGIAVASVSYRLTSEAARWGGDAVHFPAQLHDAKAAIRWLRAHGARYGLDPERIAAAGESAGGHLAALLGTTVGHDECEGTVGNELDQSTELVCFVDYFGATDLLGMNADATDPPGTDVDHDGADSFESLLIGMPLRDLRVEDAATVEAVAARHRAILANPIAHASARAAPGFIAHGLLDREVPLAQSARLAEALRAAGVRVEFVEVAGRAHEPLGLRVDRAAVEFVRALMEEAGGRTT